MNSVKQFTLPRQVAEELRQLATEAHTLSGSPASRSFYDSVDNYTARIPAPLRIAIDDFRVAGDAYALKISGLEIDSEGCGRTPTSWVSALDDCRQAVEEAQLALVASTLGEPFALPTIQDGRMVQNLVPMETEQLAQSGHGSVELEWHTEDGFDENRCRYLLLLGIRNPDAVPTTIGGIQDVQLDEHLRSVLLGERFHIRPDPEHLRQLAQTAPDSPALKRALDMHLNPKPVSVLFGTAHSPYLRLDAPYTSAIDGDEQAEKALSSIINQLNDHMLDIVVDEGDILVIDNYRAVHGRRSYSPRFDGTDRWIKRISVA